MSRVTPPSPSSPSGTPNDPKRHGNPQQSGAGSGAGAAGMPAQRPNVTTPKAPEMGASAPPTAAGQPANKVSPPVNPAARPNNPGANLSLSPAVRVNGPPAPYPAPGGRPGGGTAQPGGAAGAPAGGSPGASAVAGDAMPAISE